MKNNFLTNSYKGIPGITVIDSGKNGPNIGLFAITHGNEPVGLQIFDYLANSFNISSKIKFGKIYFICVNIEAYKKYIEKGDFDSFRFIDDNMNRISNKEFKPNSVEFKRYFELKKIFDEIDVALDIHSVPKGNDLIGLADKNNLEKAKMFFDVDTILVDDMGKTGALIGELIRNGKEGFGLECGNHISEDGFKNGITNVLNFLAYYKVIENEIQISKKSEIYEFVEEIKVNSDDFRFTKDFVGFTEIGDDEVYAIDGEIELKNIFGKNIYLGIPTKQAKKGDGAVFLFKKVS